MHNADNLQGAQIIFMADLAPTFLIGFIIFYVFFYISTNCIHFSDTVCH